MPVPLLSGFKMRLFTYEKMRARKFITFSRPCIGYLLHGRAEFWLNGQNYTATAGDLIYIASETEYYSLWIGDPQVQWYSIDFAFEDPLSFSNFRFQILKNYPVERLNEMYKAINSRPLAALSAFYALLDDLYTRMNQTDYLPRYTKIRPAIAYLQAHCTEPVKVEKLAVLCGYSEAHFYFLFQRLLGVSPITYKTNLLVQRAMRELLETDDTLDVIAARLGFSSANYFSRVFSKTVRKTPGEIRYAAKGTQRETESPVILENPCC